MVKADILDAFFEEVECAECRVLLLDYDGTLAPFALNRDEAVPYPGVRDLLGEIRSDPRTHLAVISGRASADLLPLLDLDPCPEIWGSHGWERRFPDGRVEAFPLPAAAVEGLALGEAAAHESFPSGRVERKTGCVAVHWRGMNSSEMRALKEPTERAWNGIAGSRGLEVHPFDGGLELRVPGRHKGVAVETILSDVPPKTPVAYLGDDFTDEDAFKALEGRGLGILVRNDPRPTAARLRLTPPSELIAFLERWKSTGPEL